MSGYKQERTLRKEKLEKKRRAKAAYNAFMERQHDDSQTEEQKSVASASKNR